MKRTKPNEMEWLSLDWQRPFEIEDVIAMLTHLASHTPQTPLVFEARGGRGQVKYYFGAERKYIGKLARAMQSHGDIRFGDVPPGARKAVTYATQLKITKPMLTLNTDMTDAVQRAGLVALLRSKNSGQMALQVVLGMPVSPHPTPARLPDPHASWVKVVLGEVEQATAETKSAYRDKVSAHRFNAVVRLGATGSQAAAEGDILSLLSALRTLRSAGVSIQSVKDNPDKLNTAYIPWRFPLRLSVKELANFLLLPSGDSVLPGVAGLYPKQILPPAWYRNPYPAIARTFAVSLDGKTKLSISPEDSKEHTIILGPTGSGKSTAMQRLILSDIYSGKSVLLIDPKHELVQNVLARIPKHREDDVVVIDPSNADAVVGINPLLGLRNHSNPSLVSDSILAVFKQIFHDSWGVYSEKILSHAFLTLAQVKGATLLWLYPLLTDEKFRKKITAGINDKISLQPFWAEFESLSKSEQRQQIAPVLNKFQQFLQRPGLRNVLGQSDPKFDLNDIFTKPRIVLVSLNKGLIGEASAKLLGSLIIGLVWPMALSRASIPEDKRQLVSIYLDELQNFISSIASDFSDTLAQARGLGVGITGAHQFRSQISSEILAGIDANCRNKIVFGLSASDARDTAKMAPELSPEDFMALPRYQVYTSFNSNGRNTGWISGKTLPMTPAINRPAELRKKSAARYGKPTSEIEREYLELLSNHHANDNPEAATGTIGRRKKQ